MLSPQAVSIDILTLLEINPDINKAIDELITTDFTTTQVGSSLLVDPIIKGLNNMENFAEPIKYVIFRFKEPNDINKLLNVDISQYNKVNYVNYILILIIILLIIYLVLNIKGIINW
jgi:hypothetical protein